MVAAPNNRLTELLDQLRQEFESQSRSTGEFEHQCRCTYPGPLSSGTAAFLWPSGPSRNSLDCSLTDRLCSYRTAPGDGDDSSEGVPAGTNPAQDETGVCCY